MRVSPQPNHDHQGVLVPPDDDPPAAVLSPPSLASSRNQGSGIGWCSFLPDPRDPRSLVPDPRSPTPDPPSPILAPRSIGLRLGFGGANPRRWRGIDTIHRLGRGQPRHSACSTGMNAPAICGKFNNHAMPPPSAAFSPADWRFWVAGPGSIRSDAERFASNGRMSSRGPQASISDGRLKRTAPSLRRPKPMPWWWCYRGRNDAAHKSMRRLVLHA